MSKHRKPYCLFILCAVLSLVATACFRDSAEGIGEPPVAQPLSATTVVEETNTIPTVMPTVASTSVSQISTEAPPDTYALTATVLIQRLTQDAMVTVTPPTLETEVKATAAPAAATVPATLPPPVSIIRATLAPGADCVHQIRAGDTLFMLSLAYGVSVDALANANGLSDPSRILVEQRITIPRCGTTGFRPPPTTAPTPTSQPEAPPPTEPPALAAAAEGEAEDSGDAVDPLVQAAQQRILSNARINTRADAASQSAAAIPTGSRTYTLRQYDTLYDVAQQFDTTIEAIAELNGIIDIDDIKIGDVLQIP